MYGTVDELIKRVSVLIKGLDQPGSTVYPGGSWLASLGSVARIDRTADVVGVYDTYAGSGETAIRSGSRRR